MEKNKYNMHLTILYQYDCEKENQFKKEVSEQEIINYKFIMKIT